MTNVAWPKKTRELHNHHFDSTSVLARVARGRRPSVLAVLGEHPQLVGDPRPTEREARAFCRSQARPPPADEGAREVPRDRSDRGKLATHPRVLLVRLDEEQRDQERAPRWRVLGRGRAGVHPQGGQRSVAERPHARRVRCLRGTSGGGARRRVCTVARDRLALGVNRPHEAWGGLLHQSVQRPIPLAPRVQLVPEHGDGRRAEEVIHHEGRLLLRDPRDPYG